MTNTFLDERWRVRMRTGAGKIWDFSRNAPLGGTQVVARQHILSISPLMAG